MMNEKTNTCTRVHIVLPMGTPCHLW